MTVFSSRDQPHYATDVATVALDLAKGTIDKAAAVATIRRNYTRAKSSAPHRKTPAGSVASPRH